MQIHLKQHYFISLEEFAQIINSMKPMLKNPDEFDKWMENEEIEFKEPSTQEDMKEESTSQSSNYYVRLITFYLMLYYFLSSGKVIIFIFLNKMVVLAF